VPEAIALTREDVDLEARAITVRRQCVELTANLKPDFDDLARAFANKLADKLSPSEQVGEGSSSHATDG
jgi:hypothetical protein